MYLKKLDIKGFKSFADATDIHFYPGINVIVGPNGCGKSNIVDTVRWVLGEANVRNLRGQKNEDIIFSGSDQKRALGMASVTMLIDNADSGLPVDYTEVAVGRKLFRNGDSEFYINKSRVRLKDMGALFSGTGLGKKGYSIISQGELEQVLNGQPFDRRLILEEASGIVKYRQQRDEVINRMEATGNDMDKLTEYLFDLEERRQVLQEKSQRALSYQEIKQRLHFYQRSILEFESAETLRKYRDKSLELNRSLDEEAALRRRLEEMQQGLAGREKRQDELRQSIAATREQRFEIERELAGREADNRLQMERTGNAGQRLQSLREESQRHRTLRARIEADIAQAESDCRRAEQECDSHQEDLIRLESAIESLQQELDACRGECEAYMKRSADEAEQEKDLEEKMNNGREALRSAEEQQRFAGIYYEEAMRRESQARTRNAAIRREQEQLEVELSGINARIAGNSQERDLLKVEISSCSRKIKQSEEQIRDKTARLSLLEDQERNYEGYSEDVKNVLRASSNDNSNFQGMIGMLGTLIEVPDGLETAIDVAAGRSLENIVIESELGARRAIRYIKERQLGRVTFLPLDLLKPQHLPHDALARILEMPGVVGLASRLIKFDNRCQKAVDYLLGRVLVVENLDRAVDVFRQARLGLKIVSLEGDVLNTSGAMTGGQTRKARRSPLSRQVEKRSLEEGLSVLKRGLKDLNDIHAGQEAGWQDLQQRMNSLHQEKVAHETRLGVLMQEIAHLGAEAAASLEEADRQKKLIEASQALARKLEAELQELHGKKQSMVRVMDGQREELERLKRKIDDYQRSLAVNQERREAYGQQSVLKARELEHIRSALQQYQTLKESHGQAVMELEAQARQIEADMEKVSQDSSNSDELILQAQKRLVSVNAEMESLVEAENHELLSMQEVRAAHLDMRQAVQDQESATRSLEMSRIRLEAELEAIGQRWTDTLGLEMPENLESAHLSRDVREYRNNARDLVERLEAIGPVDLDSIPAYEEIEQRYQFVRKQYDDLEEARQGLERLLKETEKIMDGEFGAFLRQADASFKRTFVEIFGGGEASLVLNEHQQPLQAGIEIVIKLPGKKLQSLNLLSGGERALTCIAFIFALLRLQPAPFCLLDEIDAALDENNLIKFTRFLKRLSGSIQFLVITHRQSTIEAGDIIYGVTMPQAGVSRVYSLNISEAVDMAG